MCPYGTLHQFVGWLFNIRKHPDRWKSNQYRRIYFLKYGILIAFLIMAVPFLRSHGVNTNKNYSAKLIRPPGSVPEEDFL